VALGLEAWWDGVQQSRDLGTRLEAVHREMRGNLEELVLSRQRHVAPLEATQRVLSFVSTGAGIPEDIDLDSLLGIALSATSYDPSTGAVESLLSSDLFDAIESPELRLALSSFDEQLRDYREDEERTIEHVIEQVAPYLRVRVPMPMRVSREWNLDPIPMLEPLTREAFEQILYDLEFQNLARINLFRLTVNIAEADDLRTLVERLVVLVEGELGG
jgi:rhodanese-related sulfurtransferase